MEEELARPWALRKWKVAGMDSANERVAEREWETRKAVGREGGIRYYSKWGLQKGTGTCCELEWARGTVWEARRKTELLLEAPIWWEARLQWHGSSGLGMPWEQLG